MKTNKIKLYAKALAEVLEKKPADEKKVINNFVKILVADGLEEQKILEGIVKSGDLIKEKINPELIAGVKIIINNSKQFDASMQKKLQEIF